MKNLWKNRDFMPMLLEEVDKPFNSKDYIYEIKFDGARTLVFANSKEVKLISRNKNDVTHLYPELQNIKKIVKGNVIFDGEIIVMENGRPSFSKLQDRMHLKSKNKILEQSYDNPVVFVAFDIIYQNKNLTELPIEERKEILALYKNNDYFFKSEYVYEDGIELFQNVCELNLEGIIAKRLGTTYEIDSRNDYWIKIKNYKTDNFFIGGYVEISGGYSISLILGEYRQDKFFYVGKVTLGKRKFLYQKIIKEKTINKSPFVDYDDLDVTYLKPKLIVIVKYMERTENGNLRQPFIP